MKIHFSSLICFFLICSVGRADIPQGKYVFEYENTGYTCGMDSQQMYDRSLGYNTCYDYCVSDTYNTGYNYGECRLKDGYGKCVCYVLTS